MEHTREIITFQFGTYANYVGAHFWNQQEVNFMYGANAPGDDQVDEEHLPQNDVLYREGLNDRNQTTYTPRMLSVDLAGTMGHLPVVGELYGNYVSILNEPKPTAELQKLKEVAEQNMLSSGGELDVIKQPAATISEYQIDLAKNAVDLKDKDYNLAESCNSWADYLYARYHPRSLNVLAGLVRQPKIQTLATHAHGVELWQSPHFNEDFCDRIRLYAEECDALQGFQLLFDIDNGFSGLTSKCLEHLNDEYSRVTFALPLYYPNSVNYAQADTRTAQSLRVVNSVLSYSHLSEHASMFTPLSTLTTIWRNQTLQSRQLPGVNWQADNLYQSSAVLAAYVDTVTLGYRLRQTPETLLRFCERVTPANRTLSAAGLAMPLGMQRAQDLIDYLDGERQVNGDSSSYGSSLLTQLSPGCEPGTSQLVQSIVARGIPKSRLKRSREQAGHQLRMSAYSCDSVTQMLQLYYQCSYHRSQTHAAATPLSLKTQLPFSYEIFGSGFTTDGFQLPAGEQRVGNTRVDSVPVLAAVQNSSKLADHLDSLHTQTHRVQFAKLQIYTQGTLEKTDYESALDRVLEFRDNYEDSHYL